MILKQKNLSGSFTIEAAVIIPLLFFFLVQFILITFSMHDTVSAKNISYRYLISYSTKKNNIQTPNAQFQKESLLKQHFNYTETHNERSHSINSNYFSIPVTFSYYNPTDTLRNYLVLKQ